LKQSLRLFKLKILIFACLMSSISSVLAKPEVIQVAAGDFHACALKGDQTLVCWGADGGHGNLLPPSDTFTAVTSSILLSCGIRTDKTLACWGENPWKSPFIPPLTGTFNRVSLGYLFACGIRTNGEIACWPADPGKVRPPRGTFSEVSVGWNFACAIKTNDGAIICWGPSNDQHQLSAPNGSFKSISTVGGDFKSCAVEKSGRIRCWGDDTNSVTSPPEGIFTSVSVYGDHACALKIDGSPVCWGSKATSPTKEKVGYYSITTGAGYACGIRANGYVTCWGDSSLNKLGSPPELTAKDSIGKVGQYFSQKFTATAIPEITHYTLSKGELPPGLNLDEKTGILSGTPTIPGMYQAGIIATNDVHTPDGRMVNIEIKD
jgi:alpha-tubulin suppressor-like RCC1 family protein